jgi:hypothetical protein
MAKAKNILHYFNGNAWKYLVFIFFAILIGLGKIKHEPWMDEWRNLSIPMQADSLLDLYKLREYESHPFLYYLLMYTVKFLGGYKAMFVLHYLAALAIIYLLLFKSAFNNFTKIILLCSYPFLYETVIFNRQYVFVLLLLFLLIIVIQRTKKELWLFLLLATLFIHLHVYCWLLILPLAYVYVQKDANYKTLNIQFAVYAYLIFQIGLAYYTAKIPADSSNYFAVPAFNSENIEHAIRFFVHGFTVSVNNLAPWVPRHMGNINVVYVLAFLFLCLPYLFIKGKMLKLAYSASLLSLLLFSFTIKAVAYRHTSFYFFNLITYIWLSNSHNTQQQKVAHWQNLFFFFIGIWQIYASVFAYLDDWQRPYSAAAPLAKLIKEKYPKNVKVLSYFTFAIDAPAGNLGRPVHALHCGHYHLYYNQQKKESSNAHCTTEFLLKRIAQERTDSLSLLILNHGQNGDSLKHYLMGHQPELNIQYVQSFDNAIETQEQYHLFELKAK